MKLSIPKDTLEILSKYLLNFNSSEIQGQFEKIKNNERVYISINALKVFKEILISENDQVKNIGLDFPILFGNDITKPLIVIVAMDPKRKGVDDGQIELSTVFALSEDENETSKNDYWEFIKPLLKNHNVYLTDIYKIYFEKITKGKTKFSNKEPVFTNYPGIDSNSIHKSILKEELRHLKNYGSEIKFIITLGAESKNAIKTIFDIPEEESKKKFINQWKINESDTSNLLFMPHVSRTLTQAIPKSADIFEAHGNLKIHLWGDTKAGNELIELSDKIRNIQKSLY